MNSLVAVALCAALAVANAAVFPHLAALAAHNSHLGGLLAARAGLITPFGAAGYPLLAAGSGIEGQYIHDHTGDGFDGQYIHDFTEALYDNGQYHGELYH